MQISISNVIGKLGSIASYVNSLIKAFKIRVALNDGTFEAETCLLTTLTNLNKI